MRSGQKSECSPLLFRLYILTVRDSGYDPTKLFQRKVNKRVLPDYYEVIKEPMALSEIKRKVASKDYKSFSEFVRDFALIPHNAQVYNRQDSQAYVDALDVKKALEAELQKLVDEKVITQEVATLPYLGEIPEQDPLLPEDEDDEEDDDEDDDPEEELEDEGDEDDDDDGKRRKRRGARSSAANAKRESRKDDAKDDPEARKKRGRPPRVDTPMEARIKAIMKAIRKPRNQANKLMVGAFERVPDKASMPEYHAEIKNPMAMDVLKRKLKRKKYNSVDHFMVDVELMFENAKQYNEEDSEIYKDAVHLQNEARKTAQAEKEKDDSEFVMEEGRIPMPNGILHNGELWKVGDWVHIQNANDLTKPIVAQIYRTWQDAEGGKWVNACWYYRPEQTVHRFDRHFLENEVVKTGQYRDHPIDEVVDRCFVMFVTRYNKGRPRDFPRDKDIYVCEARYNEENHKLNKIKTWASCLPDEVRDKDYFMDLFDAPKKLKKVPSPIAYLLKDEQKEDDDLPKPEWGADNAPPKIGAVHRRPRDPKVSLFSFTSRRVDLLTQCPGFSTARTDAVTSTPSRPGTNNGYPVTPYAAAEWLQQQQQQQQQQQYAEQLSACATALSIANAGTNTPTSSRSGSLHTNTPLTPATVPLPFTFARPTHTSSAGPPGSRLPANHSTPAFRNTTTTGSRSTICDAACCAAIPTADSYGKPSTGRLQSSAARRSLYTGRPRQRVHTGRHSRAIPLR